MPHLLSVVTACLNDRAGLERTLRSIVEQTWKGWDLVVVDGGSTDGSVDVVHAHERNVSAFVSERDRGVYDAQNKGIGLAKGTYVLFLNAGDFLASDDALDRLFAAGAKEDIVYGDVIYAGEHRRDLHRFPDRLGLSYLMRSMVCTQATLWKRDLLDRLGRYDLSFHLLADYDMLMRALLVHRATTRHVPITLAVHEMGGISSRPENAEAVARERAAIQRRWVAPAVRELYDAYLQQRERLVGRRLRALFRPFARRARSLSRWWRGVPDPHETQ